MSDHSGQTLIQYGVEEAIDSGDEPDHHCHGQRKARSGSSVDVSYELERQLEKKVIMSCLQQPLRRVSNMADISCPAETTLGLGHAVLMARNLVGNETLRSYSQR